MKYAYVMLNQTSNKTGCHKHYQSRHGEIMKQSNYGIPLAAVVLLVSILYGCGHSQPVSKTNAAPYTVLPGSCLPSPNWITTPSLPIEIAKKESFCDFYKFSLQSFVYFLSKDKKTSNWNFEDKDKFPVYNYASPGSSCKKDLATLSTSINQAFNNEVIYDNNNEVVYYSVQFTRELCDASHTGNLPDGTIELKMAWKVLTDPKDKERYISITKDIIVTKAKSETEEEKTTSPKTLKNVILGLAGIHIIQSTKNHPEMMWGSYEHIDNNPLCEPIGDKEHYSFMSKACLDVLKTGNIAHSDCNFNQAEFSKDQFNNSTKICRVFADGSNDKNILYYVNSDGKEYKPNKYDQNVDAINQLNKAMSESTYFDKTPILKNYQIVGGLWESDISKPSTELDNQRGSLEMSNTLMETAIQGGDIPAEKPMLNCFACHGYMPGKTAEVKKGGKFETKLSHIFSNLNQDPKLQHSFVGHK
jgi:hypothetical protein